MPPFEVWTSTFQAATFAILNEICEYHLANLALRSLGGKSRSWSFTRTFYLRKLPRLIICIVAVNLLRYRWHLWLESILPTRPKGLQYIPKERLISPKDIDAIKNLSDELNTHGALQRRTISWFNVFAKWTIHVTFGYLWTCFTSALLLSLAYFTPPSELFSLIGSVRRISPLHPKMNYSNSRLVVGGDISTLR